MAVANMIGEAAGELWKFLARQQEAVDLAELPKAAKMAGDRVHQAIGWLAREDKLSFREEGKKVWVSLVASERALVKRPTVPAKA